MDSNKLYTWRKEWISQYESPWGIFEKFRFSNSLSMIDITKIFGKSDKRYTNSRLIKTGGGFKLTDIDKEISENILGINIVDQYYKTINLLINNLNIRFNIIYENYRFCPECMKYGYHCIFHQINLFEHCPIHNIKLETRCNSCLRTYRYSDFFEMSEKSYICSCGHSFAGNLASSSFMFRWDKLNNTDISMRYFSYSKSHISNARMFYFDNHYVEYEYSSNYLDLLNSLVINREKESSHYYVVGNRNLLNSKNTLFEKSNLQIINENNEIYLSLNVILKNVYRSLSKYIRKKYLYNHKGCIKSLQKKRFINSSSKVDICPLAYTYNVWRKLIEGERTIFCLDESIPKRWGGIIDFPFFIDDQNKVLIDLYKYYKNYSGFSDSKMYSSIEWMFGRIFFLSIFDLFIALLNIAEEMTEKRFFCDTQLNYHNYSKRLFAVKLSQKKSMNLELHWWGNYNDFISNAIKDIKCPFPNKTKRNLDKNNDEYRCPTIPISFKKTTR